MYNSNLPRRADLPTSAQLKRSTSIAGAAAGLILLFIVLPAEYALDPTGAGRLLGLTQMGEIKMQLAAEAALAASETAAPAKAELVPAPQPAPSAPAASVPAATQPSAPAVNGRSDEVSFTLTPGEGIEIKLVMREGARASYSWSASGGVVNYDTHGDGGGRKVSYAKGRGVAADSGTLQAAFDGNHGWFWRNRTGGDVTVNLRISGDYVKMAGAI